MPTTADTIIVPVSRLTAGDSIAPADGSRWTVLAIGLSASRRMDVVLLAGEDGTVRESRFERPARVRVIV